MSATTHARLMQHLSFVLLLAACAEPSAIAPCLDLAEVRRYGVMDDSESDNAAPGVLGDIRGIVPGPNGDVFVLDRSAHRVVAFDSTGAARVGAGRSGEGPGEFRLPMHLASTARGFSVLDHDLKRITEFDWSGRLLHVTRLESLPPPWRHIVRNDTAWVAYNQNTSGDKLFDVVRLATGEVAAGRGLEPEDMPFGAGLGIAFTSNGELVVNTARPGVWMTQSGDSWTRRGTPRFPDDLPPREEQTGPLQSRVTPAQHTSSGLAVIGDSLILQGTFSYPRPFDWNDPPARDEGVLSLDVYRADGQHVTNLPIPLGAVTNVLTSDPVTGRIFLPVNQPYPQVVEYNLQKCERPRSTATSAQ